MKSINDLLKDISDFRFNAYEKHYTKALGFQRTRYYVPMTTNTQGTGTHRDTVSMCLLIGTEYHVVKVFQDERYCIYIASTESTE